MYKILQVASRTDQWNDRRLCRQPLQRSEHSPICIASVDEARPDYHGAQFGGGFFNFELGFPVERDAMFERADRRKEYDFFDAAIFGRSQEPDRAVHVHAANVFPAHGPKIVRAVNQHANVIVPKNAGINRRLQIKRDMRSLGGGVGSCPPREFKYFPTTRRKILRDSRAYIPGSARNRAALFRGS